MALLHRNLPALLCLLLPFPISAQTADELVRRSLSVDRADWERAKNYTFTQRVEIRSLSRGRLTSTESKTYDATVYYGQPYSKLVAKNDKPLPSNEEQREQAKLQKELADRKRQAEQAAAGQRTAAEKDREKRQRFLNELPAAYTFRLVGSESRAGRELAIVEATPRPGFKPHESRTKYLTKLKGKLWIDKADYQWVQAEVDVIDTVSFGWFIARLAPGAHISIQQMRVNDEVWVPERFVAKFDARIGLVKHLEQEVHVAFKNYRKFQSDSKLIVEEK